MSETNKAMLVILDGWGIGEVPVADGIFRADTPFYDEICKKYAKNTLVTFGNRVGLPDGQMGNSEVGHLNIGAGGIVYQDLLKIDNAIADGSFKKNQMLLAAIEYARSNQKKIHLLGLASDGGVHSQLTHLMELADLFEEKNISAYIHAITDGRDTPPQSGYNYLTQLKEHLRENKQVKMASLCGRYYAMDRDQRWERTKIAYDLYVKGEGTQTENLLNGLEESYDAGVTDEFLKPLVKMENGKPVALIEADDVVICFNFRTDRCRQITRALHQEDFPEFGMTKMPLYYCTMTQYDQNFKDVHLVFSKGNIEMPLGEVLEKHQKTQVRAAETEKYPHVTFFFSGGREKEYEGETRIMVNSPKVATYDLQPEMSAPELTQKTVDFINENQPDFVVLNFANPDMVGHTGIPEAIIKAVETTDACAKKLTETAQALGYEIILIADHGNAEFMFNEDGSPHTAHTTNLVPIVLVSDKHKSIQAGKLGDIAPTILKLMNIPQPDLMTGVSLV